MPLGCSSNTAKIIWRTVIVRPTTKEELIKAADDGFDKLVALLEPLTPEERNGRFSFDLSKEKGAHWARDRNIRDVLVHLYEWHQLLLNWVEDNQEGRTHDFLPDGYNWRNYGEMNVKLRDKHDDTTYNQALDLFIESHKKVMALAQSFTNEQLFTKGALPWTGNSTLGSAFISSTSSHYDWALKKILKYLKGRK